MFFLLHPSYLFLFLSIHQFHTLSLLTHYAIFTSSLSPYYIHTLMFFFLLHPSYLFLFIPIHKFLTLSLLIYHSTWLHPIQVSLSPLISVLRPYITGKHSQRFLLSHGLIPVVLSFVLTVSFFLLLSHLYSFCSLKMLPLIYFFLSI